MARTCATSPRLLDGMVGYDPEDPVDGARRRQDRRQATRDTSNRNGLKGARIGILRESIGANPDPNSDDFKKVDAVFEKNIAELKAAGAIMVDPIVIPDLKTLLAKRAPNPIAADEALKLYLARNPNSPFKTRRGHRQFARHREELPAAERRALEDAARAVQCATLRRIRAGPRTADDQHHEGDGRQQARRHRAQDGRASAA